jgi:hypothetical protein
MADAISEYQKWKQQGENLKMQAKQAIESRFRELLTEAVSLAEEYRADFGTALRPPSNVTAFRFKASGRTKSRKPAKPQAAKAVEAARPEAKEKKPDPKIAGLEKRLAAARQKLEDAKGAGAPTRAIEDRIYELDDALRLARQPA